MTNKVFPPPATPRPEEQPLTRKNLAPSGPDEPKSEVARVRSPRRIQRQRTKGWRMPEGAVYVGRPTKWGNHFEVGPGWDRAKCVEMFRFTTCATDRPGIFTDFELTEIDVTPLRGKDLCCWCPLDQPCHADVLLEIAND